MNIHNLDRDQLKSNLCNQSHWVRLLYMLLFAAMLYVASVVMWVLCILQFLFVAITGNDNVKFRALGAAVATFIHDALDFLSFNSATKPFPFAPWPFTPTTDSEPEEKQPSTDSPAQTREGDIIDVTPEPISESEPTDKPRTE